MEEDGLITNLNNMMNCVICKKATDKVNSYKSGSGRICEFCADEQIEPYDEDEDDE